MKTVVLMKREFNDTQISQRSSDKFFNATELLSFYNSKNGKKKVMAEFWSNKGTTEFMQALVNDLNSDIKSNIGESLYIQKDLFTTTRGTNGSTFMHPYLFVKFAMWVSPEFEVQIIKWVYDNLIDFRNQAGDHYREMTATIKHRYIDFYDKSPDPLIFKNEAKFLNELVFGDPRSRQRNEANEKQLNKLNQLQLANIKLINSGINKSKRHAELERFAFLLS